MIKVDEVVIVEGKYDKIKLSSVIDGVIIETNGFGIFKDKGTKELIRTLAQKQGVIILTDSDSAGFKIRNYVKNIVKTDKIKHAYIPEIYGREKRKAAPSAEGMLGVEGVSVEVLEQALLAAGIKSQAKSGQKEITKLDLYEDGLFGKQDSREKRTALLWQLGLPAGISANMMPRVLNALLTWDEYHVAVMRLKTNG